MAFQDVTPGFGSGSTNGEMYEISATSTPGTLIHTAVLGTESLDAVTVHACNIDTVAHMLTLEVGGVATENTCLVEIPPRAGLVMVLRGARVYNGVLIQAYADVASKINVKVEVDTIALV